MAKKVIIDLDASQLAPIICRRSNSFGMKLRFQDKTTGAIANIATDTFLLEVKNSTGTVILTFSMGNGVTIIDNVAYFQKTDVQMNIVEGEYNYGLYRTTAAGIVMTRLHGPFEIIAKDGER